MRLHSTGQNWGVDSVGTAPATVLFSYNEISENGTENSPEAPRGGSPASDRSPEGRSLAEENFFVNSADEEITQLRFGGSTVHQPVGVHTVRFLN